MEDIDITENIYVSDIKMEIKEENTTSDRMASLMERYAAGLLAPVVLSDMDSFLYPEPYTNEYVRNNTNTVGRLTREASPMQNVVSNVRNLNTAREQHQHEHHHQPSTSTCHSNNRNAFEDWTCQQGEPLYDNLIQYSMPDIDKPKKSLPSTSKGIRKNVSTAEGLSRGRQSTQTSSDNGVEDALPSTSRQGQGNARDGNRMSGSSEKRKSSKIACLDIHDSMKRWVSTDELMKLDKQGTKFFRSLNKKSEKPSVLPPDFVLPGKDMPLPIPAPVPVPVPDVRTHRVDRRRRSSKKVPVPWWRSFSDVSDDDYELPQTKKKGQISSKKRSVEGSEPPRNIRVRRLESLMEQRFI